MCLRITRGSRDTQQGKARPEFHQASARNSTAHVQSLQLMVARPKPCLLEKQAPKPCRRKGDVRSKTRPTARNPGRCCYFRERKKNTDQKNPHTHTHTPKHRTLCVALMTLRLWRLSPWQSQLWKTISQTVRHQEQQSNIVSELPGELPKEWGATETEDTDLEPCHNQN